MPISGAGGLCGESFPRLNGDEPGHTGSQVSGVDSVGTSCPIAASIQAGLISDLRLASKYQALVSDHCSRSTFVPLLQIFSYEAIKTSLLSTISTTTLGWTPPSLNDAPEETHIEPSIMMCRS